MTAMEVSHNQDSSARPDRDIINTEVSSGTILNKVFILLFLP